MSLRSSSSYYLRFCPCACTTNSKKSFFKKKVLSICDYNSSSIPLCSLPSDFLPFSTSTYIKSCPNHTISIIVFPGSTLSGTSPSHYLHIFCLCACIRHISTQCDLISDFVCSCSGTKHFPNWTNCLMVCLPLYLCRFYPVFIYILHLCTCIRYLCQLHSIPTVFLHFCSCSSIRYSPKLHHLPNGYICLCTFVEFTKWISTTGLM